MTASRLRADTPAEAAPPSHSRAYALLPLVVLLWGVNWPAMKVALEYVTPLWFATLRTALGAACLFAFLGERPDGALLGGFGLILVGVTLVHFAD